MYGDLKMLIRGYISETYISVVYKLVFEQVLHIE